MHICESIFIYVHLIINIDVKRLFHIFYRYALYNCFYIFLFLFIKQGINNVYAVGMAYLQLKFIIFNYLKVDLNVVADLSSPVKYILKSFIINLETCLVQQI